MYAWRQKSRVIHSINLAPDNVYLCYIGASPFRLLFPRPSIDLMLLPFPFHSFPLCHQKPGEFPMIDEYEEVILADMVFPSDIPITLDDVGGLQATKDTIWETVLLPLVHPHLFDSHTAASYLSHSSSSTSTSAASRRHSRTSSQSLSASNRSSSSSLSSASSPTLASSGVPPLTGDFDADIDALDALFAQSADGQQRRAQIEQEHGGAVPMVLAPQSLGLADDAAANGNRTRGQGGHHLLSAPLGVLFYGPPGTGKTLMAKAIARESGATFFPVNFSTLESKWFGESQKLVKALFSLARKCAPAVIFIDEVDVFLRSRGGSADGSGGGHEPGATLKGEFMAQWDGLASSSRGNVLVVGATNRPFDIDAAFLRRLPRQILFDLPGPSERKDILKVFLQNTPIHPSDAPKVVPYLVARTNGYSGSDLKELCKYAAMQPVREFIRQHRANLLANRTTRREDDDSIVLGMNGLGLDGGAGDREHKSLIRGLGEAGVMGGASSNSGAGASRASSRQHRPRPVSLRDFADALSHVRATGSHAMREMTRFYENQRKLGRGPGLDGAPARHYSSEQEEQKDFGIDDDEDEEDEAAAAAARGNFSMDSEGKRSQMGQVSMEAVQLLASLVQQQQLHTQHQQQQQQRQQTPSGRRKATDDASDPANLPD